MSGNRDDTRNILLGVIAGVAVGVLGTTIAQSYIANEKSDKNIEGKKAIAGEGEQELQQEQFKRNIQFVGDDEFAKLANAKIVIVGIGGTGSHAAHLLARTGVQQLRLIDLDQVSLSSLNRHAVATREDVGKSKVSVMKEHLLKTVPALKCECVRDILSIENGRRLIMSTDPNDLECISECKPDFVIDCIDNVETKAYLLSLCKKENIPVITSCGAGCRCDPTKLTICDISEAAGDPLLRSTKQVLGKTYKIREGIPCLFSSEKPPRKLLPFTENEEDINEYSTLPDIHMRVRIVPVLGPMPAIWGNALAMYVINTICNQPFTPQPVETRGRKYWDTLLNKVNSTETKFASAGKLEFGRLNKDEAYFIVEYLWNFVSAYSGIASSQRDGLIIARWDIEKPLGIDNAIPLLVSEVARHYGTKGAKAPLVWSDEKSKEIRKILSQSRQEY